ncbi:MAG: pyridoxal phosphate-dependent aminotransferase [Actinobacteria bacterium]|nr:pyridoxal phosphate-dependent aminotransferase [Actinomycetota bacterium]
MTSRLQGYDTTIFSTMSALAAEHDAVNLGQGYPDDDGPDEVKDAVIAAIRDGRNQYAPGHGVGPLRAAVVEHQRRFYGIELDPDTEVTATAGATEALCAAILALCEVGDEVITFEPYYDSYVANIAMAGAVRVPVTLRAPDWSYDPEALEAAVGPRTRLIVLNSPHNPTGKVFTRSELEHLASVAVAHDLVVVTDEVYEHLVFDGEHIPIATLPGMRDRTVTISSAGKTFSFTGWKIGWMCAAPELSAAVRAAKQWLSFSNNTPGQFGIATALALGDDYYAGFRSDYRRRRDRLVAGLREVGLEVHEPAGTYFATADVRPLGYDDGMDFCQRLPAEVGVAAIPNVAFYDDVDAGRPYVRFAFCKSDATIDEAVARLAKLAPGPGGRP